MYSFNFYVGPSLAADSIENSDIEKKMWESRMLGDSSLNITMLNLVILAYTRRTMDLNTLNSIREIPKCVLENLLHVAHSCLRCVAPQTSLIDAP